MGQTGMACTRYWRGEKGDFAEAMRETFLSAWLHLEERAAHLQINSVVRRLRKRK
jgi:hypothetical protein